MVVSNLPRDLGLSTNLPLSARGGLCEFGALHTVAGVGSVDVVACFGAVPVPGRATREAARVCHGGAARCRPGIVLHTHAW